MRFTYHIGLHCTDEDRALRCLLKNTAVLAEHGIAVAPPGRFRPALREAMLSLKGAPAPQDIQERLLDAVVDLDSPSHVLFSSDSFLCVPQKAAADDKLYPLVGQRAPWIRNLFPEADARFALALRNPATLLPALQARFRDAESFDAFIARLSPEALSWADMVARLRAAVPDAEIVVWCNEDAPLLWTDLLHLLAGLPDGVALTGADDFLESLMDREGTARMTAYLESNPARSPLHRRQVTAAFLDRFARPDAVEETFELSGWTSDRLMQMTERYEADIARIGRMDGIQVIAA